MSEQAFLIDDDDELVEKTSCNSCNSSDARAVYSSGSSYCFSCETYFPPEDEDGVSNKEASSNPSNKGLLVGKFKPLGKRRISEDTCRKFGYKVGTDNNGTPCHIAPFYTEEGELVAQSLRYDPKDFKWIGKPKECMPLFGQHVWKPGGKRLIITEGEIDALSISEVQDNRWPVVSLGGGASSVKREFERSLSFIESFETVIICFDSDKPGKEAALKAANILSPGKAHIVTLPYKDANEMLVAGKGSDLVSELWNAKPYRPDGIVQIKDIKDKVLKPIEFGLPWWDERLTDLTYGRRTGELYCIGAGTGIGKTDWLIQQIEYDLNILSQKVGVFFFEQQPEETIKRLCSKHTNKGFYLPKEAGNWTDEELNEAIDKFSEQNNLYLYDHFGCTDWSLIEGHLRYLAKVCGVKLFYIDHLTALAAGSDLPEKDALEAIMADLGGLVKELDITIHLVSHLATPEKTSHEEGGRVTIRNFKGSRAIGFWCHFMFGIERNPQHEDINQRKISTLRVLKDRLSGRASGKTLLFTMKDGSYQLTPVDEDAESYGFGSDDDVEF